MVALLPFGLAGVAAGVTLASILADYLRWARARRPARAGSTREASRRRSGRPTSAAPLMVLRLASPSTGSWRTPPRTNPLPGSYCSRPRPLRASSFTSRVSCGSLPRRPTTSLMPCTQGTASSGGSLRAPPRPPTIPPHSTHAGAHFLDRDARSQHSPDADPGAAIGLGTRANARRLRVARRRRRLNRRDARRLAQSFAADARVKLLMAGPRRVTRLPRHRGDCTGARGCT